MITAIITTAGDNENQSIDGLNSDNFHILGEQIVQLGDGRVDSIELKRSDEIEGD